MSTTGGDREQRRITDNRYGEIKDELARLDARMTLLEQKEDAGVALAEELGGAALRALQRRTRKPPAQTKGL